MEFQIFVEKQSQTGFVAMALGWPDCVATGQTKQDAVENVRAALAERLARGEIIRVQIGDSQPTQQFDPWLAMAGSFADDPTWDEYEAELRRIRQEANRD